MNAIFTDSKNYNECSFKLKLPIIRGNGNTLSVWINIFHNRPAKYNMLIDRIEIKDTLGKELVLIPSDNLLRVSDKELDIQALPSAVNISIMPTQAALTVQILTEERRKYIVRYLVDKYRKITLKGVSAYEMNTAEEERLTNAVKGQGIVPINLTHGPTAPEYMNPVLTTYCSALDTEMRYLRQTGGRKYQVSNGRRIARRGQEIYYSFDLEAELFIAEDSPVVLYFDGMSSGGTVQVCEEFYIVLAVDKDFGDRIHSAYFSVEPWKLLEAMKIKLQDISLSNEIVWELLDTGPMLSKPYSAMPIEKGQKVAEQKAFDEKITVIWGPPGTGKTYTMSRIAMKAIQSNLSVLIVSHSNISVDGVIKAIDRQIKEVHKEELLHDGRVLRYGYVRDDELSKNRFAVAYNYVLEKYPYLKHELKGLQDQKDKLLKQRGQYSAEVLEVDKQLKRVRIEVREREKEYAQKACILATTISKVTVDKLFENVEYDIVMFDEVSMAYVPQLICAASYARRHFVCVGDFRQLAPIAQSEAKNVLEKDIFTYLGIVKSDGGLCFHPWLVMLDEQRRMHPDISAFPNRYIYNHLLRDHESVKNNRNDIVKRAPFADNALYMIDTSGTYCSAMKNSDNSRFNVLSAVTAFLTALEAEKNRINNVGIITPYAAQTRLIRALIKEYRQSENTNISCATVHQFQGSERDVIIFDAVEDFPFSGPGWLMGKNQNGSVTRLINVAITRAKGKFITVADYRFWKKKPDKVHTLFYDLVDHIVRSDNVCKTNEKKTEYLCAECSDAVLNIYPYEKETVEQLIKDLEKAQDKIVISIPDGALEANSEESILNAVEKAASGGRSVLCKTKTYALLPDRWKKYTVASENAAFPVIIIDDNIFWYGLPYARGRFEQREYGFNTVIHTSYRIKGKHFIEVFKSLSDFEFVLMNGRKTPLVSKIPTPKPPASGGLYEYIEQHEQCPKCKAPLQLIKSRRGRFFMKCSSCSSTELITTNMVNRYINEYRVVCPEDHHEIQARLGQYGVYIKCNAGHTLKIDQI